MQHDAGAVRAVQAAANACGCRCKRPLQQWRGGLPAACSATRSQTEKRHCRPERSRGPCSALAISRHRQRRGLPRPPPAAPPAWRSLPGPARRLPVQAQVRISLKIIERLGLDPHRAPSHGMDCTREAQDGRQADGVVAGLSNRPVCPAAPRYRLRSMHVPHLGGSPNEQ